MSRSVSLAFRSRRDRLIVSAITTLGIVGLTIFGILNSLLVKQHASAGGTEDRGIDISSHQKDIDWRAVAKDDVHFAYIKATEGNDFVDPMFRKNWRGARQYGLPVGAYHFFTLCSPGIEQAENFLRTILPEMKRTHASFLLPFAIDMEFTGGCKNRPEGDKARAEINTFLQHVETVTGQRALFYVSPEFEKKYPTRAWFDREHWEVDLYKRPSAQWRMWQYSHTGRVHGIETEVDLNTRIR